MKREETQKITAHVPVRLLKAAMEETGAGITETVKEALETLARKQAYAKLHALRGKINLGITAEDMIALRKDKY